MREKPLLLPTYFAIIVLAVVFLLIASRQIGGIRLGIWQIMLGGALAVVITGQIPVPEAILAINFDVMIFLFGMFVVGETLTSSGYLADIANRLFSRAKNGSELVLIILFGMGILSAILMNDTLAIIATPLVLGLSTRFRIRPQLLLLALAFAITTGSVMSPIGNPQNLLIAVNSGMTAPFTLFALYLAIPTIISLIVVYGVLRFAYRPEFILTPAREDLPAPGDDRLILYAKISLVIILFLSTVNIVSSFFGHNLIVTLPMIALIAAAPILLLSPRRIDIVKKIDWPTLLFFASMFVLMASVWKTEIVQQLYNAAVISSVPSILFASIAISQVISNVPFVALFQPAIIQAGGTTSQLMALAAGSTIAGNLTILGAASNVIIIQNAEKHGETITFIEFAKIGIPVTLLQFIVYAFFLTMM